MVATAIGHSPWNARAKDQHLPGAARLHAIAKLFDGLLGELLASLKEHGLDDDVLIVVTGDHGLRYSAEFESLGEEPGHGDAEFNVPFLLYAPGLFERQVRLSEVTSHVDITPTLLSLLGMHDERWMQHGMSMLDPRIADRMTFMLNAGLSPVDGFHWRGSHYTVNHLTGEVRVRRDEGSRALRNSAADDSHGAASALPDDVARTAIDDEDRLADETACAFLARASEGPIAYGAVSPAGESE